MYFSSSGPPSHNPVVVVTPWLYDGNAETGKSKFKALYDVGPMMDTTSIQPYTAWNSGADQFGAPGFRKPVFSAGLQRLEASSWREVWDSYTQFQQKRDGAHASIVLLEAYPMNERRFANEANTSFPHRHVRFKAAVIPWYEDEGLDGEAVEMGKKVRQMWKDKGGMGEDENATQVHMSFGELNK